ncbi:hypothetical protein MKEN_00705100 [Mycena kentingensis (nom. inval.)]|nr:hypothetical protein MKEN_00705100 [Mycena kentingensis (nom. inval.)]
MNTRSRVLVARNESKIKSHADTYQAARAALASLEDTAIWPPLRPADIRCLEDPDDVSKREARNRRQIQMRLQRQVELLEDGLLAAEDLDKAEDSNEDDAPPNETTGSSGEGRRTISWIWTIAGDDGERRMFSRFNPRRMVSQLCTDTPMAGGGADIAGRDSAFTVIARARDEYLGGSEGCGNGFGIRAAFAWRAEEIRQEKWKGKGHRRQAERQRAPEGGAGASEDDQQGGDKEDSADEGSESEDGEDSEESEAVSDEDSDDESDEED